HAWFFCSGGRLLGPLRRWAGLRHAWFFCSGGRLPGSLRGWAGLRPAWLRWAGLRHAWLRWAGLRHPWLRDSLLGGAAVAVESFDPGEGGEVRLGRRQTRGRILDHARPLDEVLGP